MTPQSLASVALVLVAAFGSTGCCNSYGHVRYGYRGMRMHHMVWVPRVAVAAPAPAPPPPVVAAPEPAYAAYSGGSQPIVVHANVPGTTVIIINPPGGGQPTVQYLPTAPAPQQAPQPRPVAPAEESPGGWGQEE
jgi:hypothetical protein